MLYVIHGDDTASSRKFLTELTEKSSSEFLDGKNLTVPVLEEKLLSIGLFGDSKAVVVENLLTVNKKKKDICDFVNQYTGEDLVVFWESKKITKQQLGLLKKANAQEFSHPVLYFQFLDSFSESNGKKLFSLYHKLLTTTSEEVIYYSLLKRLRYLVILSDNKTNSELSKMASWQLAKLNSQLRLWSKKSLFSFYNALKDTEIMLKSGKLPISLSKHLDILLLTKL